MGTRRPRLQAAGTALSSEREEQEKIKLCSVFVWSWSLPIEQSRVRVSSKAEKDSAEEVRSAEFWGGSRPKSERDGNRTEEWRWGSERKGRLEVIRSRNKARSGGKANAERESENGRLG